MTFASGAAVMSALLGRLKARLGPGARALRMPAVTGTLAVAPFAVVVRVQHGVLPTVEETETVFLAFFVLAIAFQAVFRAIARRRLRSTWQDIDKSK